MDIFHVLRLLKRINESNRTISNDTFSNNLDCTIPQDFSSFTEFFQCYKYFFLQKTAIAISEIALILFTVLFNSLVIILIISRPIQNVPNTVFDRVLIGINN